MLACVLGGLGNLFTDASLINELLPSATVKTWAVSMILGGSLALAGAFWRDRISGLLMERIALVTICVSCLVYGIVITYVAGQQAAVSGSLTIAIGVASGWRAVHVQHEIQVLRSFMGEVYR